MSDHAARTYKQGEGLGIVFSGTNVNASPHPFKGDNGWLIGYEACTSSSSKSCENHNAALVGNIVDQFKEHEFLAVERVKFKEFKLLGFDINQKYTGGCKAKSCSAAGNVDLVSHVLQSGETTEGDWAKFKITDKSTMRRNVELFDDEITFSERVSARKLAESSIKWKTSASYQFQDLDVCGSEFEHFPISDIDRKRETIMASTTRSACGAMFVKMKNGNLPVCESPATSSLVELAPVSLRAAKNMIDNTEKTTRCYEVFQPNYNSNVGSTSFPAVHGCKCQKTDMAACKLSCGLAYKVPANTKLRCMQHKLCCCSSSNKFMTTGNKNNNDLRSTSIGILSKSQKDGSTLAFKESSPNDFPCHFSTEKCDNGVKDDSSHRLLLGQKRLGQPDDSDMQLWPSKIPKCSMQDVSQPGSSRNLKSVENEGFHKFSSTTNSLLVADEMGTDKCHRKLMMGDSAFTQVKETAFSKIFIIPTRQNYGGNEITSEKNIRYAPFGNYTSEENMTGHGVIGTHLMGAHIESSTKTDTVYQNPFHRSSSLLGETFSSPSKCVASPNPRKSNSTSASLAEETLCRSVETGITDREEHPASTEKAEDHFLSLVKIADVPSYSRLPDDTSGLETCSRWVKRLQHNNSETPLCTKRYKQCGASSFEKQNMCSIMHYYHAESYDVHRRMKEEGKFEKTMPSSENLNPSLGDIEEGLQSWFRRWHCNSHQPSPIASRPVEPVVFRTDNLRVPPDKFEGKKFASIGAMALMGKAMINYRPFRFQRKEASLVWTT